MKKHSTLFFMLFLVISKAIYASGNDSLQKAIALKVAPLFDEAQTGLLPKNYVKKGDTCIVVGVNVDTSGVPWFNVAVKTKKYWSQVKFWQYVSDIDTAAYLEGKQSDEDRKRRLRILHKHRDWTRRIIRAVRYGRICLDMTGEQCIASWGNPIQKSNAYTIGLGTHDIWIFNSKQDRKAFVLLKKNRVIGWSLK